MALPWTGKTVLYVLTPKKCKDYASRDTKQDEDLITNMLMIEHPDVTLIYLVAATKNYQSLPSGDNRQEKNGEYDHHQLTTWPQRWSTIDTVLADSRSLSEGTKRNIVQQEIEHRGAVQYVNTLLLGGPTRVLNSPPIPGIDSYCKGLKNRANAKS